MSPNLLPLVPGLPLLGAVVNAVLGPRVPRAVTGAIGTLAVAASAVLSFMTLASLTGWKIEDIRRGIPTPPAAQDPDKKNAAWWEKLWGN